MKAKTILFNKSGKLVQRFAQSQICFEQIRGHISKRTAPSYYYFWDSLKAKLKGLIPDYNYQLSRRIRITILRVPSKTKLWGVVGRVCRSPEDNELLIVGGKPNGATRGMSELLNALQFQVLKYIGHRVRIRIVVYN